MNTPHLSRRPPRPLRFEACESRLVLSADPLVFTPPALSVDAIRDDVEAFAVLGQGFIASWTTLDRSFSEFPAADLELPPPGSLTMMADDGVIAPALDMTPDGAAAPAIEIEFTPDEASSALPEIDEPSEETLDGAWFAEPLFSIDAQVSVAAIEHALSEGLGDGAEDARGVDADSAAEREFQAALEHLFAVEIAVEQPVDPPPTRPLDRLPFEAPRTEGEPPDSGAIDLAALLAGSSVEYGESHAHPRQASPRHEAGVVAPAWSPELLPPASQPSGSATADAIDLAMRAWPVVEADVRSVDLSGSVPAASTPAAPSLGDRTSDPRRGVDPRVTEPKPSTDAEAIAPAVDPAIDVLGGAPIDFPRPPLAAGAESPTTVFWSAPEDRRAVVPAEESWSVARLSTLLTASVVWALGFQRTRRVDSRGGDGSLQARRSGRATGATGGTPRRRATR